MLDFTNTNNKHAMLWNPCTGLASQSLEIGIFILVRGFSCDHVNDKRTIQDIPVSGKIGDANEGIFVSGTVTFNWIHLHDTLGCLVISLDLVKETLNELSLPQIPENKTIYFPKLCVLRNCLAVCFDHEKTHWFVWLMKECGVPQSWTKLDSIRCHPRLSSEYLRPLYIWGNDVMAVASSSKIVPYNLDHGSFEFPVINHCNSMKLFFHIYHESLVLLPSYLDLRSVQALL
ncbi:hypothetical protein Ahy_B01g052886 [Arachis hypogaea]|uniref:F-box associated domain-containing protein n=1 Tax=Arachis hypogaea TaxID=3818 RepID=A0A445AQP1_ARAHY|nr:hypothetical protein Ahy_B01g052886 [Arachis hypogaea]